MRQRILPFLATLGGLVLVHAEPTGTIVPESERVDDVTARLEYARILAYRADTLGDAVKEYERVLREQPTNATALAGLADAGIRQGDLRGAEERLAAVLRGQPAAPAATAPLARLYLWTDRPAQAEALLRNAGAQRALGTEESLVLAQALTRLGRLNEAQDRLDALLAQTTAPSAELLSASGDVALAAGRLTAARDLYHRAREVDPTVTGAQRGYALTLAWTGDDAAARPRLEAALRANPHDRDVIHALLDSIARQEGEGAAATRARAEAEAPRADGGWRIEWAELEARRGHGISARRLFAAAQTEGDTPELRLRAGRAALGWGDFNRFESALREALAREPRNASWREEMGRLLVSADRFEEAEQWYERWLLDSPGDETAELGLIRLRLKQKDFAQALRGADAIIERRSGDIAALRLRGEALVGEKQWALAEATYRQLAVDPTSQADAEIMLGRIARRQGKAAEAAEHFASALRLAPGSVSARYYAADTDGQARAHLVNSLVGRDASAAGAASDAPVARLTSAPQFVEWAGLFAQDGDFADALSCLEAARSADPEYFPAWAQLAEFRAIATQFDAARREYAALKEAVPDSRQILLGEARMLAWSRQYDESLQAYARLAALNPADPVPRREAARTAGWGKMRARSAALYATAWADPVDVRLAAALANSTDRRLAASLTQSTNSDPSSGTEAEPFAATERFYADRPALRAQADDAGRAKLDALYVDLLADYLLQRAWWLENEAKQRNWERRYHGAETSYRQLLAIEPGNEEAWFDLSQVQAAQGLGAREHATLDQLLALDPNHTLAGAAVARRAIRSRPLAAAEGRSWHERGRGDLASLERTEADGELQDTWSDQINVRASAAVGRETPLAAGGHYAFRGEGLGLDGVFAPGWSGAASFAHREFYDSRINHLDTGDAQLWYRRDALGVGAGIERREEVANPFALFDGTRSDNVWLGGLVALGRRFDVDGRLTGTGYSDGNHGVAAVIRPAYAWTDHPDVFKTILTLEYRDTNRPTVYRRDAAGHLVGLIYPYWTPRQYTHGALTLEWYRDRAREFFIGSAARTLDLRLTFGTDSESNPSATFEGDWNREWRDRWVVHASAYANVSREWNAVGLRFRLARRF